MPADKFDCSADAKSRIDAFTQADSAFRSAWQLFEQQHAAELDYLDRLREERNAKLDEARRILREEAMEADITQVKYISAGPFTVQKKWHGFYIVEKLMAKLEARNLLDTAFAERILVKKVEAGKYDEVHDFLQVQGIDGAFEDCEDGEEMTPAVSGPKPIGPFGAEQRDAK